MVWYVPGPEAAMRFVKPGMHRLYPQTGVQRLETRGGATPTPSELRPRSGLCPRTGHPRSSETLPPALPKPNSQNRYRADRSELATVRPRSLSYDRGILTRRVSAGTNETARRAIA